MGTDKKPVRQANIELLRIIAMIMVVAHHLSYFGGVEFDQMSISVNRLWTQFMVYGGHVGVDIFVLISGYFMISQKSIKLDKIARLWLMMLFYSVGVYLVAVIFFEYPLTAKLLLIAFTPFLNEQWPFASAFLVLLLVAPFVNIVLNKINKSTFRVLLGVMIFLWVIIPTISTFDAQSNYLVWMVVLYAIAGYVRLYSEDFTKGAGFYICGGIIVALLSYASAVVFDIAGLKHQMFAQYATHFSGMQHANIVLWAILLFIGFVKLADKKCDEKESKIFSGKCGRIINLVASLMFGVYLMHEDFFARAILWEKLFDNNKYSGSGTYILITIGEITIILIVGAIVEWLRINLLERFYMKGVKRALSGLQKRLDGCMKDA